MSFWKRLFGGGPSEPAAPAVAGALEYQGFLIRAEPYQEAGAYQTAGTILKTIGGVEKQHRFIRADRYPSLDAATEIALAKGRQIVDEQGERMFD